MKRQPLYKSKPRPIEYKQKARDFAKQRIRGTPKDDAWQREYDLLRGFGITTKEYEERLLSQKGVCAICGNPETIMDRRTNKPRSLAVDHCHKTNKVRALLCMRCNQGIGNFQEDLQRLKQAVEYLEGYTNAT